MFSKFSRFRSKASSNPVVPQTEHSSPNGNLSSSYGKPPTPPSPQTPPQRTHKPNSLPTSKPTHRPSLSAGAVDTKDDSDMDSNVTFAESLFPITPMTVDGGGGRRTRGHGSTASFVTDEEFSPDGAAAESRRNSPFFYDSTKLERERSSEMVSKKSWGSQDMADLEVSSKRSWDKRSWALPAEGNTKSRTSSSVPEEEEIDSGPAVLPQYDDAEEDFLEEFEDFFENLGVENVRREQYPQLDQQRLVYLDYASFALYSRYQVEQHMKILLEEGPCLGSVAVSSPSDNILFLHVSDTQDRLLSMLNTNRTEYSIIFTPGFQDSFRVVAESYPFQRGSPLLVCQDNHAAVRQVIQSASRAGGKPLLAPVADRGLCFDSQELRKLLRRQAGRNISKGGLFVFPAQSNLSGIKHSLHWAAEAQQNGWHVCVDATTLLPTGSLDLLVHRPDFVVGSFHHMLGYPSGLGFLLVRRDSFCVQAASSGAVELVRNQEASEGEDCHIVCPADNTMNLLQFAALSLGLRHLESVGLHAIQKRVAALSQWLVQRLRTLRHKDDDTRYLVRVYGSHAAKNRGGIVSFNVIDSTGTVLPPDIVRKLAARSNITLAVGSFGNPGLGNLLGMPDERVHDVGAVEHNWNFMAVRASFGPVSNFSDVYRLVQFLSRFRDEEYLSTEAMGFIEERTQQ